MIIGDLDVERVAAVPLETDSPLIIDPNAILPCTVAAEFFEAICGWDSQVIEVDGVVDHS